MAPQFSTLSVQKYIDAATNALPAGVQFEAVESYHAHPLLLEAFADRVRAARPQAGELVVFTAHSLPKRAIDAGDRYADEVAATARGVAERAGVTRTIGIPMAPQFSTLSVQKYIDAATGALPPGMQFESVESFHTHPLLLDAFAERVAAAQPKSDELVVFTAHSLPERVIASGDRYADEVAQTARGVAARAGINSYERAYQSAGRTPEPWIGPSLDQLIDDRSATIRKFLVVPIGFVCDHTEILFDIDVQAARVAREFSTTLRRTESLNTSPTFIAMLEDLVRARLSADARRG